MNKEVELLKFQNFLSFLFIMVITVSIILVYNRQLMIQNKNPFLTEKESIGINNINRTIILMLFFGYLYINYQQKDIHKNEKTTISYDTEIIASYFSIIAALVILYGSTTGNATLENPEL